MASSQIVRYKHGKTVFEVMTRPGSVLKYRDGKLGWDNVLVADEVFTNSKKGDRAKASELKAAFGTDQSGECAKIVVERGELQLSAAERKEKVETRKREIIGYLHKHYVDPKTKMPHPFTRIENAMDQIKYHVDADEPVEKQVDQVLKKMPGILTFRKEEIYGVVKVGHAFYGQCQGLVQKYCKVEKEDWDGQGCSMRVSLVPGDYDTLASALNKVTKGEFQFEVDLAGVVKKEVVSEKKEDTGGGRRGKKGKRGKR